MPNTPKHPLCDTSFKTTLCTLFYGGLLAVLMTIPFYNWVYGMRWHWAEGFPFNILSACLSYMTTFFHEIGHTLFAWFYGHPALPMFDFAHGGGLSLWSQDQNTLVLIGVYALLGYGIFLFRDIGLLRWTLIGVVLFHLATAYNDNARLTVIDLMGPLTPPLIAAFFLIRALFNLTDKKTGERLFNAIFGFSFILHSLTSGFGLLQDAAYRIVYFKQKGGHGFGDFDKIADRLSFIDFTGVIWVYIGLSFICLAIPFILFWYDRRTIIYNDHDTPHHL